MKTVPSSIRRDGKKGFTLMELLIATAAGAVILAAVFGVFSRAIHLRDDANVRTHISRARAHTATVIRNDLRGAWVSGKKLAIVLKGSRDSVEGSFPGYLKFTTTTAVAQPEELVGEVQQVEYYIIADTAATDRNAGLLVRAVDRNLLAPVREKAPEEPLLAGIESMEVSFYDGGTWKDSWEVTEENTALPQAIRVRLQPAGGSTREKKPAPIEVLVPWTTQIVAAAATPTPTPQ